MSKIGRKPIAVTSAKVEIIGNIIKLSGAKGNLEHEVPAGVMVTQQENKALLVSVESPTRQNKMLWGLHRALLANKVKGVETGFTLGIKIVGLGYKAQASGQKMTFILGYSHKVYYELPKGVSVDIDRSGQNMTLSSIDKWLLGSAGDQIRKLRLPEPYKGTGIIREHDVIIRKAGKAKAS